MQVGDLLPSHWTHTEALDSSRPRALWPSGQGAYLMPEPRGSEGLNNLLTGGGFCGLEQIPRGTDQSVHFPAMTRAEGFDWGSPLRPQRVQFPHHISQWGSQLSHSSLACSVQRCSLPQEKANSHDLRKPNSHENRQRQTFQKL